MPSNSDPDAICVPPGALESLSEAARAELAMALAFEGMHHDAFRALPTRGRGFHLAGLFRGAQAQLASGNPRAAQALSGFAPILGEHLLEERGNPDGPYSCDAKLWLASGPAFCEGLARAMGRASMARLALLSHPPLRGSTSAKAIHNLADAMRACPEILDAFVARDLAASSELPMLFGLASIGQPRLMARALQQAEELGADVGKLLARPWLDASLGSFPPDLRTRSVLRCALEAGDADTASIVWSKCPEPTPSGEAERSERCARLVNAYSHPAAPAGVRAGFESLALAARRAAEAVEIAAATRPARRNARPPSL